MGVKWLKVRFAKWQFRKGARSRKSNVVHFSFLTVLAKLNNRFQCVPRSSRPGRLGATLPGRDDRGTLLASDTLPHKQIQLVFFEREHSHVVERGGVGGGGLDPGEAESLIRWMFSNRKVSSFGGFTIFARKGGSVCYTISECFGNSLRHRKRLFQCLRNAAPIT